MLKLDEKCVNFKILEMFEKIVENFKKILENFEKINRKFKKFCNFKKNLNKK